MPKTTNKLPLRRAQGVLKQLGPSQLSIKQWATFTSIATRLHLGRPCVGKAHSRLYLEQFKNPFCWSNGSALMHLSGLAKHAYTGRMAPSVVAVHTGASSCACVSRC